MYDLLSKSCVTTQVHVHCVKSPKHDISGTERGTERPSSGSGPAAVEEGSKARTIQVSRGIVDAKGKRVWTVKDGGGSSVSGKAEGGSTAPAAVAASSGAAE